MPSLPPRQSGPPRQPVCDGPYCLRLSGCRLGLWGCSLAGPPMRSLALQPGNSPPSRRWCSRAASESWFPVPLRSELQGSGFSPGRFASYCTRQPSLDTQLDVKVSLHPAQASRRPCDGPVSSHTTCWLYDTAPKSMPWRGREHQWNKATDICNTFCIDSSVVLVPRHRREVSSLARRVMLQPVSVPLQDGLRFFPPPYPHRHQLTLRPSYLPFGRSDTGLPRSTRLTRTG
jgi:hypothetical protein